jgi:hypothetical protein
MRKGWIAHPLTRGLELDDPRTTDRRREIIKQKPFPRDIYTEWYAGIVDILPDGPGGVLELGSGPGFLGEFVLGLITSETFLCPGVRVARRPAPAFRTRRAASHSD